MTDALEDRYGRGKKRGIDRRIAWGAGAVLLLSGLAVLLFGGGLQSSNIEFKVLSYEVDATAASAMVDFQVSAKPGSEVACAVEALSESYATVGWKVISLPASDSRTQRLTESVVTTYPATTATLRSCWVLDRADQ